jgi:3',5'-nucleoside bisphosphate phosphatase
MPVMFDLHTHTTSSDGTLTPGEMVRLAVKIGIRHLAITDHDTVSGLGDAINEAGKYPLNLIPGVELSCDEESSELHILGLDIDPFDRKLAQRLVSLRETRDKRVFQMVEKLRSQKINVSREDLQAISKGDSIGRMHLAMAIVEKGAARDTDEAFEKYLRRGASCYVPREKLLPDEAIKCIIEAGGVPVVAHPGFIENIAVLLPELVKAGLQGIEAYYPSHTPLQTDYYVRTAAEYGLIVTAGSDFHGPGLKRLDVPGCFGVPDRIIEDFIAFCKNLHKE